jgi:hypothetical protein
MASVVRIEILSDDQFPWHVEKGHAGWIGTAEPKRKAPLIVSFMGFAFILIGAFAPARRMASPDHLEDSRTIVAGG